MPHTNTWEKNGLYRKFTGILTGDEILESNLELHVHPDFENIKYVINDFLDITEHDIAIAHTRAYAKSDNIVSSTKGELNIAIVVNQDELLALANHYRNEMLGNLFECEIFKTVDEARSWVNKK